MSSESYLFILPNREEQQAWDALVRLNKGSIFSYSNYLNALEGDWGILFNAQRSGGMVCPFITKMGQKILMNPTYHQFSEWLGEGELTQDGIDKLQNIFNVSLLCFNSLAKFENVKQIQWKHQLVGFNEFKINSLAKRMLKKSENYTISFEIEISSVFNQIVQDLVGRVQGMNQANVIHLKQIAENFQLNGLTSISLLLKDNFQGGIWLLETDNAVLYLKGSVNEDAKRNGGMYRLIFEAIQYAHSKNKTFEFGGSNVENVRRFNLNLGGVDQEYQQILWNNAPFWWKSLRKIRHRFKGK